MTETRAAPPEWAMEAPLLRCSAVHYTTVVNDDGTCTIKGCGKPVRLITSRAEYEQKYPVTFTLISKVSGNVLCSFTTRDEALEFVRVSCEDGDEIGLFRFASPGDDTLIAAGPDLFKFARSMA